MWTTTIALTTKESSLQGIIKCGKKVKPRGLGATGRFRAERRNDVSWSYPIIYSARMNKGEKNFFLASLFFVSLSFFLFSNFKH